MTENSGSGSPRKILIQAPNWLGDVIMTTPLLTWLAERRDLKGGTPLRLHLGVRRVWAPLFLDDPRLDGIVIHERRGAHAGMRGSLRYARGIRGAGYDAVLVGPPSLRAAIMAAWARVPRRIGHGGEGRGLLLTDCLSRGRRGTRHFSSEMLELGARLLGEPVAGAALPSPDLPGCRNLPPESVGPGPGILAVAPGTTYGEAKTWPLARVAQFMNLVLESGRSRVVLLGDAQASGFAAVLRDRVPGSWSHSFDEGCSVVDLTGRTDLPRVVRVLKGCRGFVGNDSGLMHVAAALGVPTVGIFGSSNPDWTAPRGTRTAAVVAEGYACRPCYRRTCNQPRFCLEDVTAGSVMDALDKLIEADDGGNEDP